MKNIRLPFTALLASFGLGMLLHADGARADLTLDSGFDTDGIAQVDIAADADIARELAVQSDGALVLAGRSRQTVGPDTIDFVALTRLDGTTGALDPTFGTDGIVTFLPGLTAADDGGGDGRALLIQPVDQKIVVAGTWDANGATAGSEVFVARFDASGVLDDSFGTDGVVLLTPAGVTDPTANAVALRSDGSIIVVGGGTVASRTVGFVTGVDSDGDSIPGFDEALVEDPLGGDIFALNALVILPGDGILAAGGGPDVTLAQFTSGGAPDAGFGTDGIASFNVLTFGSVDGPTPTFDVATALTVLGDGRILVAGRLSPDDTGAATNRFLARVTAAGVLDATFGSGGLAPLPDLAVQEVVGALGVRPSGDIVLVGRGFTPTQVSPNGIALSTIDEADLPATFPSQLADLEVLGDGSLVAAGQVTLTGADTALAAVRFDATDLADGPDTVPDPFGFFQQTGLEPGFTATSNTVTISGLGAPAPIRVSSGESYSVGCTDTFTSEEGEISNGETVCVQAQSPQGDFTSESALLTIGGVVGDFTVVTGDATPDQFTFVDQTGVAANTQITSAPITLDGLATRTAVSVTGPGALFSIGCTATYTATPAPVDPGAQICVRHTSSSAPGGKTDTVLRVGVVTIVQDTFSSTTVGDVTPDTFSFVDQTGVAKSTVITSASVTLTGFDTSASIAVQGGEYSIGCTATFTSAAGTVAPNATVCVRHTSAAAGGTATNTTLTVGTAPGVTGVSDTFTSTTAGVPDTTPDAFSFPDQTSVPLATVITSGAITIGGFDTAAAVSITGGTYSVGCTSTFIAAPGTLPPNSLVCVRHTSAVTGGAATNTVLTVGGVSDTFTSTTLAGDAVPAPFSLADQTGVDLFATITSAPVTITGIDIASPISVTGGEYSIGCTATFTATPANVSNGQTVCVRHTSSFDSNDTVDTVLTISTVSDTFTSTTRTGDQTPEAFSFDSQTDVALNAVAESNTITISGVDSPVLIFVSGPDDGNPGTPPQFGFSKGCTGNFDGDVTGDVLQPGDTLCAGVRSAVTDTTSVVVTVTIGGSAPGSQRSATFTVTTGDTVPAAFTFTDQVGVPLNATVDADPITITGITAPSAVSISSNGQYQIDCTGAYTRQNGVVTNGQTICVRQFVAGSLATLTDTILTVGSVSDTFTTTTTAESSVPGSSAMTGWELLLLAPLVPLVAYRRRRSAL